MSTVLAIDCRNVCPRFDSCVFFNLDVLVWRRLQAGVFFVCLFVCGFVGVFIYLLLLFLFACLFNFAQYNRSLRTYGSKVQLSCPRYYGRSLLELLKN